MQKESYKLGSLEIENFRIIQFMKIQPDPQSHKIIIKGKNGNGKTSASDSLIAAVGGKKFFPKRRPIRDGEIHAHVEVILKRSDDNIIIRQDWDRKEPKNDSPIKEKRSMRYASGKKITAITTFLDDLLGQDKNLSFDPGEFLLNKDKQRTILLSMLGIDELLKKNKDRYTLIFDKRTDVNRDVRNQKGVIANIHVPDESIPTERISAVNLTKEITVANVNNQENNRKRDTHSANRSGYDQVTGEIEELRKKLTKLKENQNTYAELLEDSEEEVENLEDIDTSEIIAKLGGIETQNEIITKANKQRDIRKQAENRLTEMQAKSDGYTGELETIKTEDVDILKNADFPVTGLSVDDDDVLYNGMPFGEESDSRQRIIAMDIALSRQPKDGFRFVRFRDASLFDNDSLNEIFAKAEKEDALCLAEIVGENGPGMLIQDGLIIKEG